MAAGEAHRGEGPVVCLLGDVMLGRGVAKAIRRGSPQDVWSPEVRAIARSASLVVCNLECCISERGERTGRVAGKPFFFRGPPAAVESLRAIGARVAGLANNHALDYEADALGDTLALVADAGIEIVGAGRDVEAARRGVVVGLDGMRLGVVAVSDHPVEFAATAEAPGIAYADLTRGPPGWMAEEISRLSSEADLVLAFCHWGPNMTTQPARWQRRTAAGLVEAGADVVAGHSAHVFHGVGWSERGPVLYDLGDALDDYAVDSTLRNDLGLIALWRPRSERAPLELVGLYLDFCRTELATGEDAEWIARRLVAACEPLGTRVERVAEQRFRVTAV